MAELTVVTFNLHAGMRTRGVLAQRLWSRRGGSAASTNGAYAVVGVLADLDPDVAALQESWSPDGGTPAVRGPYAGSSRPRRPPLLWSPSAWQPQQPA